MTAERKRVLIVEDDGDTRDCLAELFELLGHEAVVAGTGVEALRRFAEHRPSVAFIDIGLPDMSGHELARALRALAEPFPLRLVALSGWSQARVISASMDAGMDLHVVKPIGFTALRGIVGDATDQGPGPAPSAGRN
jgi:two-component system CheB/CheR fusion protein